MDEHTLNVLDFPRLREILAGLTQTEMGRSLVAGLKPGQARAEVEHSFDLTREALALGEEPPLGLVTDIGPLLDAQGVQALLSPQDLLLVSRTLDGLGRVHAFLKKRRAQLPGLAAEGATVKAFAPLKAEIDQVVLETGEIRDDATPELSRVRSRQRRLRKEIVRAMEETVGAHPDLFQDRSVGVRAGRFVLQLKAEARTRFDAILHGTSDSGHTLFVEPLAMLTQQNELARLRSAEQDEIERILRRLSQAVRNESPALHAALNGIARLDLAGARKRFAVRFDAVAPRISERGVVQLVMGRHPLLEVKKQSVVPLTFVLPDQARVVVISGPNAGGKTVAMKTLGLFSLMLSAGLFLPVAEGSELPLFSKVFADIGDEQSLEGDLSSFSAHLLRVKQLLEQADASSLVLLDEIGGSTSPEEGSALAIAVLEQLRAQGTLAVATSHLGPLKAFVQDAPGMANAAMEFTDKPTYRLLMGVPGESSALAMAAQLGFPGDVLTRARRYMDEDWLNLAERLKSLSAELDKTRRLKAELVQERSQAVALRKELEEKTARLRQQETDDRRRTQVEQAALLKQTRRDIENLVRQIREQQASHEAIKAAKNYVEERLTLVPAGTESAPGAAAESAGRPDPGRRELPGKPGPRAPQIGDYVHSRTFRRDGSVVELARHEAVVAFGNVKMRLPVKDLEVLAQAEPVTPKAEPVDTEPFDPRLDVHGLNQEEARARLAEFLDAATLSDAHQVTVLHGKGSGKLRALLWENLKRDRRVQAFRPGGPNEGGNGITFVTLKNPAQKA
jgi:DNA mismatch repair protein MutS2